jgi:hypothetical protein
MEGQLDGESIRIVANCEVVIDDQVLIALGSSV